MLARVAVAASGGRDSTALLHCTARAAAALGVEVVALHVHHGLQAQAETWLAQVRRQAQRWGVEFACQRLLTQPQSGDSIEAWARRERYRALAELAHASGCGVVLLAHHRRDQAETWLLQALRGGGPPGLAAMPREAQRDGLRWCRPWLDQPREAIEAYVRRHRLAHVEDPSNADPRHARNRLRLQVWPALQSAFADAETAICAAAGRAQQAAALADEVAELDLPPLLRGAALCVADWCVLPTQRRRNALKAWLAKALGRGSPHSLVERLMTELPTAQSARWEASGSWLHLHRGLLQTALRTPRLVRPSVSGATPPLDFSRPGRHPLPTWHGHFEVTEVAAGGAPPGLLRGLLVGERRGGERFRLGPEATARGLKKQFQARAVPAWARDGPLLFAPGGQLVFVPGLGIEGACQATPGQPQFGLTWVPAGDQTGRRQMPR